MPRRDDEEKGIMAFNKSIFCVEECCASGVGKKDGLSRFIAGEDYRREVDH